MPGKVKVMNPIFYYAAIKLLLSPEKDASEACDSRDFRSVFEGCNDEFTQKYGKHYDFFDYKTKVLLDFIILVLRGASLSRILKASMNVRELPQEIIKILWPENTNEEVRRMFTLAHIRCRQVESNRKRIRSETGRKHFAPRANFLLWKLKRSWLFAEVERQINSGEFNVDTDPYIRKAVFDLKFLKEEFWGEEEIA